MIANTYPTLELSSPEDYVVLITMNRPDVRNALNTQMMTDLRDCFRTLYVEQHALRVVVLTGAGDQAFCAGGDLKERNGMSDAAWRRQHAILEQMVEALLACPLPVMAAVNGSCFGGGLEVALSCDFIYAADSVRLGFPEGKLGIMPGACGTQNLVRACGQRRAKEIMLSGLPFSASDALVWGIINRLCPAEQLLPTTLATAQDICSTAPLSAQQIKKAINIAIGTDLSSGFAFEIEAYNRTVVTQDRLEGVSAFNQKRTAKFTGE